jgi:hypothetical protein
MADSSVRPRSALFSPAPQHTSTYGVQPAKHIRQASHNAGRRTLACLVNAKQPRGQSAMLQGHRDMHSNARKTHGREAAPHAEHTSGDVAHNSSRVRVDSTHLGRSDRLRLVAADCWTTVRL